MLNLRALHQLFYHSQVRFMVISDHFWSETSISGHVREYGIEIGSRGQSLKVKIGCPLIQHWSFRDSIRFQTVY